MRFVEWQFVGLKARHTLALHGPKHLYKLPVLNCLSGINTAPDIILGGCPFKLHLNFLRFS